MPARLHCIVHQNDDGITYQGLTHIKDDLYRLESLDLSDDETAALTKGSWLFRHSAKRRASMWGGKIVKLERRGEGYAVVFKADPAARGKPWEGDFSMRAVWSVVKK
jgi:hypothetical protein